MTTQQTGIPAVAGSSPIYALRDYLEAERLRAIEDAAAFSGQPDAALLEKIAHLHMALVAVRDEIDAHMPKLGAGSEQPLQ